MAAQVPPALRGDVLRAQAAIRAAAGLQAHANTLTRAAGRRLVRAGLSVHEAAGLLGVTPRRLGQLLAPPA